MKIKIIKRQILDEREEQLVNIFLKPGFYFSNKFFAQLFFSGYNK